MKLRVIIMAATAILITACGPEAVINNTSRIENGRWAFEDVRQFSMEVPDVHQDYNYYILLRHSGNYAYSNLVLYFKTYYPNNTYKVDTINCPLADASGKWNGSGLGDMLDNNIAFKRMERFPVSGTYNFEIQHAMRPDTIHEIYDIGLLIEKAAN